MNMGWHTHQPEIDHRTTKLIVGVIALSLASLTSAFAREPIASISASYYESGWSSVIFIGFLFAIAAFLLAYNGYNRLQMVLSKIAAAAALGIALFPCGCGGHQELIENVHGASAAVMFIILAVFCYVFFRRAMSKPGPQAKGRALIYAVCGLVIAISIALLAGDFLSGGAGTARIPRLTFYGEMAALLAFGVSWLAASHYLPVITSKAERRARAAGANSTLAVGPDKKTA
jgi:hypothetical protein